MKINKQFEKTKLKIEKANELCNNGNYRECLNILGKLLSRPKGITIFQLNMIADTVQYATGKSVEKAFSKMKSIVFEE